MPTSLNKYLDHAALDETVVNIRQIVEGLEEEMQNLPYARPDGLYPDMTVGAVIGADSTAQWAQRESEGTGSATVRSVQGAAEVQDGELVPVQIAGITSTDAQGAELDAIEWTAQTLRAAGSVRDELTAGELVTRVGVVDLGTLNWIVAVNSNTEFRATRSANPDVPMWVGTVGNVVSNCKCAEYESLSPNAVYLGANRGISIAGDNYISVGDSTYTTAADFKAAMNGVLLYYELATPTTQPISPALPMTYKVQQGGTESIVVPDGEISAAPVLTVAEPVNISTELARIWAAIESLGYTRNTAQLSRPISLTDTVSMDETQKDTADVVEIDTTKEVTE